MENGGERVIPRTAIAGVGAVAVASVLLRAWLEDIHGFGWEAARAVLDAIIDISLGVIVAALIIDRISKKFTIRSLAREGWSGFRLMTIAITDSLGELATGLARQYGVTDADYKTQQLAEETWREVAGPPTKEGAFQLIQLGRLVKSVEEAYTGIMHTMVGVAHAPGQGKAVVSKFENVSKDPDLAKAPLQTIDDSAWHLAELWPRGRPFLLEANLELQRSARRWSRLSTGGPDGINPEFDLITHRLDIARAVGELLDDAVHLYIALLVLGEEIRTTGISAGSDRDKLERMLDQVQKMRN
jgi:hypothetical protein